MLSYYGLSLKGSIDTHHIDIFTLYLRARDTGLLNYNRLGFSLLQQVFSLTVVLSGSNLLSAKLEFLQSVQKRVLM